MKRDELQNIWKKADCKIEIKSQLELNDILEIKMKNIMKKYFFVNYISVFVGLILIVLLVYACIKRSYDQYYLINNIVLCIITSLSVIVGIWSYCKMNNNKMGLPLKDWLRYRIRTIEKAQKRYSLRCILILFIILPYYLSFSVYFMNRPFMDVIYNEQFYISFLIVFCGGSFSALYAIRNMRAYSQKHLDKLRRLYNEFELSLS